MITGAHSVIYSTDAEADRVFLRDVLKLTNVDVGHNAATSTLANPSKLLYSPVTMTPTRVASILLGIGLLLSTQATFGFTALYAFGDSLTDTTHHLASSSYWMGRFSNGPLWVEYLSPLLGFSYNPANNSAFAGSTTSSGIFPAG